MDKKLGTKKKGKGTTSRISITLKYKNHDRTMCRVLKEIVKGVIDVIAFLSKMMQRVGKMRERLHLRGLYDRVWMVKS